jgi:hypothetical protein
MNLVAVLGSAGASGALSLAALVLYLLSKREKRVKHKFQVTIPRQDGETEVVDVIAKGPQQAQARANKLINSRNNAA